MALCDKTYRISRSYSLRDLRVNEDVTPIWDLLGRRGYKVGMLNVPTTNPAPEVNGFLVSGGGGGVFSTEGIPAQMVYPQETKSILESLGYIFDIRLLSSGAGTFSELVDNIELAEEGQKNAFLQLCSQHQPDFGFFCFRITTELQYLAMSEIENYKNLKNNQPDGSFFPPPGNAVQQSLLQHYKHMDLCIKELIETLKPEHIIFTADHGTAPYRVEFNTDVLLRELGFLNNMSPVARLKRALVKQGKSILPGSLKAKLKPKSKGPSVRVPATAFERRTTRAFGTVFDTGNFAGIYINDGERFGGPVSGERAIAKEIENVIDGFNQSEQAKLHGLNAVPYQSLYAGRRYHKSLPDIRIIKPDHYFFTCRKSEFAINNENYGPVPMDIRGLRYPHTGVKGSHPLFVLDKVAASLIRDDDPDDLRTVYRVIDRLFP